MDSNNDLFNGINIKRGISPYDHATGDAPYMAREA